MKSSLASDSFLSFLISKSVRTEVVSILIISVGNYEAFFFCKSSLTEPETIRTVYLDSGDFGI